jgi:hypothetical protein
MKLKNEIAVKFWTLPEWAKRELFYCDMGWEYTGNEIMGWDYLVRPGASTIQKELYDSHIRQTLNPMNTLTSGGGLSIQYPPLEDGEAFGFNIKDSFRIPSSVKFYGLRIHDLLCNFEDNLEVDAELIGDEINFSAVFKKDGEDVRLTGIGGDSMEAAFNLFAEAAEYYETSCIPSLSDLEGIEDTFEDRRGECSINFEHNSYVSATYNKYKRFCQNINSVPGDFHMGGFGAPTEEFHFKMRMVEGLVNIYSNYGEIDMPINALTLGPQGNQKIFGSAFIPSMGTLATSMGTMTNAITPFTNSNISGFGSLNGSHKQEKGRVIWKKKSEK